MHAGMQRFHRGVEFRCGEKYLLITRSFPHSPQAFPQGFSTGKPSCGYSLFVHIKQSTRILEKSYFFWMVDFYQGKIFVQKLGLDKFPDSTAFGQAGGSLPGSEKNSKSVCAKMK